MVSFRRLLRDGRLRLESRGIRNAGRESEWLLERAVGLAFDQFRIRLDRECPAAAADFFASFVERRQAGEPLQHILGDVDFFGYRLEVGSGVLIPRPETECLVDLALRLYPGQGSVCDVCTGSGAIALVLACELRNAPTVVAGDLSAAALAYAARNRDYHQAARLHLFQGDLFQPLRKVGVGFSMITANPPYVSGAEYADLPREVRGFDPASALLAGADGMSMVERVLREGRPMLAPGGWLLCEIGESQGAAALRILERNGYIQGRIEKDLAGRDRMVVATVPHGLSPGEVPQPRAGGSTQRRTTKQFD